MDMTVLTPLLASHAHEWGHGWWPVWPLLWLALIVAAVWFITRRRQTAERPRGVDRARDILAERYASGEITADEYRERLERLG
jgi:putative membrane protein